jgi:hypothetical protein
MAKKKVDLVAELLERVEGRAQALGLSIHGLFDAANRHPDPGMRISYSCWGKWKRGDVKPQVRVIEILLNTGL